MTFDEKHLLMNNYFIANFNYCLLVWMLSSANSRTTIKSLQKRALRFLCNGYEISYEKLLSKPSTSSMNAKRLRVLCVELYKTISKTKLPLTERPF